MTNSLTKGRELYEAPSPQLPPRPQTTESSGLGSLSRTTATLDTSSSLSKISNATTIFSDTELGTAIATEDLALLRLGRSFGVSGANFDWRLGKYALRFAKCIGELTSYDQAIPIQGRIPLSIPRKLMPQQDFDLLQAGSLSASVSSDEAEHAKKALLLLSPGDSSLRIRHITASFCEYFFHVCDALQCGNKILYQVPVTIRAKFEKHYPNAWNRIQRRKESQKL